MVCTILRCNISHVCLDVDSTYIQMTIISMLNLNGFVAVPEEGDLLSAPTWMIPGTQSNFLGESVKVVLQRDPRRFAQVVRALHGRPLPSSLRSYIWMDVMLKHERDKINDVLVI